MPTNSMHVFGSQLVRTSWRNCQRFWYLAHTTDSATVVSRHHLALNQPGETPIVVIPVKRSVEESNSAALAKQTNAA